MKIRTILLVILTCSFFTELQAQISIGAKLGYTQAWQEYQTLQPPSDGQIHLPSYHASLILYKPLNQFLAISSEPGFVERGASGVPGFQPNFEGNTKLFLQYIQVPTFLECNLPILNNRMKLIGGLGYSLGFLGAAYRVDQYSLIDIYPIRIRLDDTNGFNELNRWDHGAHGKLALAVPLGYGQLLLESSYYHGFRNTNQNNDSQNRGLNFSIGWRSPLLTR